MRVKTGTDLNNYQEFLISKNQSTKAAYLGGLFLFGGDFIS